MAKICGELTHAIATIDFDPSRRTTWTTSSKTIAGNVPAVLLLLTLKQIAQSFNKNANPVQQAKLDFPN